MEGLKTLIDTLPRNPKLPITSADDSVRYVTDRNHRFVAPELELHATGRAGGDPSVILISAAAAVGKSTLASEIAYQTGSAIWDLAQFHVGNDFFVGTLASHFGYDNLGRVFEGFENGKGCVILDAVDEAQLKAGPRNFDAFLDDLARAHQKSRPRPSLILLARPVTADLVAFSLELADVAFRHYEVGFFGEAAAKQLIDVYLDDAKGTGQHRTSREPFEELREALFEKVFQALGLDGKDWSSERARRFMGYAPVLAAIASFLDVPNYLTTTNEIKSRKVSENLWAFLAGLVKTVLKREQKKTIAGVRSTLIPTAERLGWSGWDTLYREEEQCARVLAHITGKQIEVWVPDHLPAALRAEYEDALGDWLPNHPFCHDRGGFANVVFQDYVYAHALAVGPTELSTIVRDALSSESLPTPLLGAFLLTLASKSKARRLPVIDAADVGSLYDSMLSFSRRSDAVSLDLAVTEESGIAVGIARFPTTAGADESEQDLRFEFLTGSMPVRFGQQLVSAIVDLETDVELGYAGRLMTVGPDVVISCRALSVSAAAYRIDTTKRQPDDEAEVAFIVESINQSSAPELKVYGDGFSVQTDDVTHPWAPYRKAPGKSSIPEQRWEAFSRLRKIFVHFRAHGKTDLARYADFVDKVLVGKTATGKALLELLLRKGLLEDRGHIYVLSRKRMRELGVNRTDLVESRMSSGIAALLNELPATRDR